MDQTLSTKRKWREADLMRLLDLYEERDILWNPTNRNYKNTRLREEALESIVAELQFEGATAAEIRSKLKALRSTYIQELGKIDKSIKAGESIFKPRLVWFERADSFLRRVTVTRKRRYNDADLEPTVPLLIKQEELMISDEEAYMGKFDYDNEYDTSASPLAHSSTSSSEIVANKRFKEIIEENSYKIETSREETHEFDIFGSYVASCLKKLPLDRALRLQGKINNDINEERINYLIESSIHQ